MMPPEFVKVVTHPDFRLFGFTLQQIMQFHRYLKTRNLTIEEFLEIVE